MNIYAWMLLLVVLNLSCTSTEPNALSKIEDCVPGIFDDCLKKHSDHYHGNKRTF